MSGCHVSVSGALHARLSAAAHTRGVSIASLVEAAIADLPPTVTEPREVLPIVVLDGEKVGAGKTAPGRPGPLFVAMHGWYQAFKAQAMRGGSDGGASDD